MKNQLLLTLLLIAAFLLSSLHIRAITNEDADPEYEYDFVVLGDVGDIVISVVSDNGKYIGGTYYGNCFIHNTDTKETQVFNRNMQVDNIAGITNDGTCYGMMGDIETAHPGYRTWGGEWTELPGIGEDIYCALMAASCDGKLLGGWSYEGDDHRLWKPCLWTQNEEGNYVKEFLPFPITDFTGREAQGSRVVQFSSDNSIIRGLYLPYFGPGEGHSIIWRQGENGYEYEMVGEEVIYDAETGQSNETYYLSPYYTYMSPNGKYIVSSVQYYRIEGAVYSIRQEAIFFNIETPGSAPYQIIEDPNYGDYAGATGVYGAAVLNDGYVFGSTPFQNGQYPSTGLAYTGEGGYIDYADWLKETTDIDIFENSNVLLSGFPVISGQENLFAGSYSLGPNANENVTSYYIKKRIKINIPEDEFTFLMGYREGNVRYLDATISLDYEVNAEGEYKFAGVESGDYKYIIKKDDYPTLSGILNVPDDLEYDAEVADLYDLDGYFYQPDFSNYHAGVPSPLFDVDFVISEFDNDFLISYGILTIDGTEHFLEYDRENSKFKSIPLEAGIYEFKINTEIAIDFCCIEFYEANGKMIVVDSETFIIDLILTDTITNIDQIGTSQFSLYPNPFTDKIVIGNPGEVKSVSVYNVSGQCVLVSNPEGTNSISTSNLPKGTYVVTIEDRSGNKSSYKMIK